jgi:hypothetical protein
MKTYIATLAISFALPGAADAAQRCLFEGVAFEKLTNQQSLVLTQKGAECVRQASCFSSEANCFGGIQRLEVAEPGYFARMETIKDYNSYRFKDSDDEEMAALKGTPLLFKGARLIEFETSWFSDYYAEFKWKGNIVECQFLDKADDISMQLLNAPIGGAYNVSGYYGFGIAELHLDNCRLDVW